MQEFESIEAAEAVMASANHSALKLPTGEALRLDYSYQNPATHGTTSAPLDWKCNMCKATNFARQALLHGVRHVGLVSKSFGFRLVIDKPMKM